MRSVGESSQARPAPSERVVRGRCRLRVLVSVAVHAIDTFVGDVVPIHENRGSSAAKYEWATLRDHPGARHQYGLDPRPRAARASS